MSKEHFLKFCQKEGYFQEHQRVLIALSGGLDSMTLLDWLYDCRQELGIEIGLAHINHKQRPESDAEEMELQKIAKKLGIAWFASSFSGIFSENAARKFRYEFFQHIMKENGYTALVTAHHADDQVETIFMRLLRGTRLRYLQGIPQRQDFAGGELIRPLLFFHKKDFPEILHFEDSSNAENHYLRNRIRNTYLPTLEQENPRLREALLDTGRQVSLLYQALEDLTAALEVTDLALFRSQTPALQQFLLEKYCQDFPDLQLSREQFEQVWHILQEPGQYHHPLRAGYELYKDYQRFEIRKISPQSYSQERSVLLEYDQQLFLAGYLFSFGEKLEGEDVEVYHVSRETPILIRHRQPQDKILLGGHHKKLRRYFIDQKIPKMEREQAIVLEQEGKILGIAGMVAGDLSKSPKSDIMNSKLYIQRNR